MVVSWLRKTGQEKETSVRDSKGKPSVHPDTELDVRVRMESRLSRAPSVVLQCCTGRKKARRSGSLGANDEWRKFARSKRGSSRHCFTPPQTPQREGKKEYLSHEQTNVGIRCATILSRARKPTHGTITFYGFTRTNLRPTSKATAPESRYT